MQELAEEVSVEAPIQRKHSLQISHITVQPQIDFVAAYRWQHTGIQTHCRHRAAPDKPHKEKKQSVFFTSP